MGEWLLGLAFLGFAFWGVRLMKRVDRFLEQEELLRREQEEALEHLRWKRQDGFRIGTRRSDRVWFRGLFLMP